MTFRIVSAMLFLGVLLTLLATISIGPAEDERDAAIAKADGEAYRVKVEAEARAEATRVQGIADAEAIQARQDALSDNPLYVDFIRAQNWDGALPMTILGDSPDLLMNFNPEN